MYTYAHLDIEPKIVRINEVKWKVGDGFEVVESSNRYIVTQPQPKGFHAMILDHPDSYWFEYSAATLVRRLNVVITTSYQK